VPYRLLTKKLALQRLVGVKPKLRILAEQFGQKEIAVIPEPRVRLCLVDADLAHSVFQEGFIVVLAFDRVEAHEQHVRNDAVAEHIALVAIGFFALSTVLNDLRGHVAHGSAALVAF
jgi:hypothetical protein